MAKNTARPLGYEVDVDRDEFTYLAPTVANGNEIKAGSAAATAVGAGAAAEQPRMPMAISMTSRTRSPRLAMSLKRLSTARRTL